MQIKEKIKVLLLIFLAVIPVYSLIPSKKFYFVVPRKIEKAIVTAYSSTPDQTDNDPFITASGKKVYEGLVANNCKKFGTKILIMGKVYTVDDRKNKRYGCNWYDIWMPTKEMAKEFGIKKVEIEILD